MDIEVVSASKFPQKTVEAPSSVTIITAADIKAYGYRTLSDALRSVRGIYISNDRFYEYVGVRGFKPPGDYSSRLLVLIDGYRINDPLFDAASIGDDFMLDVDLIDRIEVIRGAGSSVYGSNAVFGVINVITKGGADINGLRLKAGVRSFGVDEESAVFGKQFNNGLSVLLSASRVRRDGHNLFFPEFDTPETNNGVATHLDWTDVEQYFAKIGYRGFSLSVVHSTRDRGLPAAPYGIVFNDPRAHWLDKYTFADLSRYDQLNPHWSLASSIFYGRYVAEGDSPVGDPVVDNRDEALGEWWGGELKLLAKLGRHKLVLGTEYQDNLHQDQKNFDVDPREVFLDDKRSSERVGVYAQDEVQLSSRLLLNAGLRYDRYSGVGDTLNPRLALIWNLDPATSVKALYGRAFRAANAYELFYNDGGVAYKANPALRPESIKSYEIVLDRYFGAQTHLTLDAFYNSLNDLIAQEVDPADGLLVFRNSGGATTKGVEAELERVWSGGARVRASYAWQLSRDRSSRLELPDSPRSLAKLNLVVPMLDSAALMGLEMQYTSRRITLTRGSVGEHLLTNLTVSTNRLPGGLELSASVYNVFDVKYADPGGPDLIQDSVPQDGRSFRITLARKF